MRRGAKHVTNGRRERGKMIEGEAKTQWRDDLHERGAVRAENSEFSRVRTGYSDRSRRKDT